MRSWWCGGIHGELDLCSTHIRPCQHTRNTFDRDGTQCGDEHTRQLKDGEGRGIVIVVSRTEDNMNRIGFDE